MRLNFKKEITQERASQLIFIAIFIIYAVISMTKNAYPATMASIIGEGIFTKATAGFISAGFYLLYGIAQLLGVGVVDKVSPVKLVYITLIGTVFALIGMAFVKSFYGMLLVWCFCGLIQFAIWPAVLRVIAEFVLPEHKAKSMTFISFSYCVGAIANYLIASIVLDVSRWEMLFIIFAVIVVLCIVMWALVVKKTKDQISQIKLLNSEAISIKMKSKDKPQNFWKVVFVSGIGILLVPSFIRTAMDAGLKAWVPTMIIDSYGVTPSFASVLTTVLVVLNLGGVFITNFFYPKFIKNASLGFGVCFLVSVPFTVLLLLTGKIPVFVVVLLLTVVTTLMYSGHQLINVIMPSKFAKYNMAGSVAAILNGAASLGAVFANIIFGVLAQNYGWNGTIIAWIILLSTAGIFCLVACPLWGKFIKRG